MTLARTLLLSAAVLLGAVGGAWLSLASAYLLLEPAERTISNAALITALVLLVFGAALLARKVFGTIGLAALTAAVALGAVLTALAVL